MANASFRKKKSKRVTCRQRYKIEKKVKQHNKKLKKEAKKKPSNAKRKRKDPGIPNSLPFKEAILKEAEDLKIKREEERQRQKERRKKDRERSLNKNRNLESLVKDAQKRANQFDRKVANKADKSHTANQTPENSLKAYYKEFQKVVKEADVVLQVLDARDPVGSRCPQVEEAVLSAGSNKKLVLILNKIDLVPRENVEKWLKYLRNEFPTVAFKASTQTQRDNLSHSKVPVALASQDLMKTSKCLGADMLMKLLGNYCRNQNIKSAISVGVVGFPNTGKSSIINSLKRSKACDVGPTPGVTRSMQLINLDKHIKLLDSPGIVMAAGSSETAIILKNAVKVETLEDPITPAAAILRRCPKSHLMLNYNIPDFSDENEFLALMAKRMGRLKKGGVPDINKAAKTLIQDWNIGKITYYTHPPEQHTMPTHISADIITEMSKAFDIDSLLQEEQETLKGLKNVSSTDIIVESSGPVNLATEADLEEEMSGDDEEEMDEEEEIEEKMEGDEEMDDVTVAVKLTRSRSSSSKSSVKDAKPKVLQEQNIRGNRQQNKDRKKAFKKMKKDRKKSDKVASNLSDALESAMSSLGGSEGTSDAAYSFATDFKL